MICPNCANEEGPRAACYMCRGKGVLMDTGAPAGNRRVPVIIVSGSTGLVALANDGSLWGRQWPLNLHPWEEVSPLPQPAPAPLEDPGSGFPPPR